MKDNFDRFTREKNTELERAREMYENVKNSLEDALVDSVLEEIIIKEIILLNRAEKRH